MSIEKFLSRAHPSSLDRYVDKQHNIQCAYDLIEEACYILTVLENDKKRYSELYTFLDKKETYLKLHKELDCLLDKYNLREWVIDLKDCKVENEDYEINSEQCVCRYNDILIHADKLVERDLTWKHVYYDYSEDESVDCN